jgi:hypothetical protein
VKNSRDKRVIVPTDSQGEEHPMVTTNTLFDAIDIETLRQTADALRRLIAAGDRAVERFHESGRVLEKPNAR